MADTSNPGLNMSELMNCIKVFITDSDEITLPVLTNALQSIAFLYKMDNIPVLLYPLSFSDRIGLQYEKTYILWILNMDESDKYFAHLRGLLRTTKH